MIVPANRFENGLTFEKNDWGKLDNFYISLNIINVSKQTQAPLPIGQLDDIPEDIEENFDFAEAPDPYMLFNFDIGFIFPIKKQRLGFHCSIDNLLNTSYRDYMNRFRYYADDLGRNFILRIKYSF